MDPYFLNDDVSFSYGECSLKDSKFNKIRTRLVHIILGTH